MPFKEKTIVDERNEFVRRVLAHEATKAALCREYGISRPTGDNWLLRHAQGEPLTDRGRAPHRVPNKTDAAVEAQIVALRTKHPALGAKKLHKMLAPVLGDALPAVSTVNEILKRNGCISAAASAAATPYKRFERSRPNDLWQMDFKGHFALDNGQRCHPLTVIDDHSRFGICLDAKLCETRAEVEQSLLRAFRAYGLPRQILCDNGSPWGNSQTFSYTKLEIWLLELDIHPIHGRVRHPQTQGKDERFNGTLKREHLAFLPPESLDLTQQHFDEFLRFYNFERPHHALGLDVPASRYYASERKMADAVCEWDYAGGTLRTVKSTGYLAFQGQGYFLSEALGGKTVCLIETETDGVYDVTFHQFTVAQLSTIDRAVTQRRIRRTGPRK